MKLQIINILTMVLNVKGLTWSDDEFMKTICARRPDLSYCTGKFLNGSISSDIQNSTFPPDSNSGSAENISKDYSDRQKPVEEAAERPSTDLRTENRKTSDTLWTSNNNWGFPEAEEQEEPRTEEQQVARVTESAALLGQGEPGERNGGLNSIGPIDVGFGVGVGVPFDPVNVGTRVGVKFGGSGLAGYVPIGFPNQGERRSLNDYDGNKLNIVPDRFSKYIQSFGGNINGTTRNNLR